MTADFPPWQIKVIPLSDESAYYLLIRIHHLILDEQKNLKVAQMILLDRSPGMAIKKILPKEMQYVTATPLNYIIKTPENLLSIYDDILDALITRWNDFVLKHDSLDHHDGVVKQPTDISELCSSLTMIVLNTYIEYKHHSSKVLKGSSDPQKHFRFISNLASDECEKRQVTFKLALRLILRTLHPINIFLTTAKFFLQMTLIAIFLSPFYIIRELNALRKFLFLNEEINSNSFIGFSIKYSILSIRAVKEIIYFIGIIFNAPKMIVEEIFLSEKDEPHCLKATLCGRKLISWSEKIPLEKLHEKAVRNKQSYAEILFSAISSSLKGFFNECNEDECKVLPSKIKLNFRSVPFSYLYGTTYERNGVIGLNLPINEPSVAQFVEIREQFNQARKRQAMIYLLSLIQIRFDFLTTVVPSLWLRLLINFISKKYSISVNFALGLNEYELKEYKTCYDGEIEDVIFFRTPQANVSINLTIQRFKDDIQLNIMCDSNIDKQHVISNNFKQSFNKVLELRK
jgi:hypothetical protein